MVGIVSSNTPTLAQLMKMEMPKIIGHRGCRAPGVCENTAAAMCLAIEQGADIVEFDVVSTKDGHFVALHWPDVRFLSLRPWSYRLEELPPLDTLPVILQAVGSRVPIYLDIKQPLDEARFLSLAEVVDAFHHNTVIVGSFSRTTLRMCAQHRPQWILNYDCLPVLSAIEQALEIGARWINPLPWGVRQVFAERAIDAGLCFVPAGNESDRRQLRFARWGAYALSTFRPAHLRHVLEQHFGAASAK